MIGQTISHYKVLEKIGQGGMGVVYRAQDTTLGRDVAIKVLPEQFTKDPQRLARFEREAKLLASLNHPNIAAIYGLEEAEGVRFLALELVEGETLAEQLTRGRVPVEKALEICRQIADGVEAAHEKGVIHRDLKPSNVKITPEGKVKILDFGLAKAFEEEIPVTDISHSPTLTEEMTRAGVILGTAAYMSPEQARGEEVDKRADIFAFGCVLYELLTGKRAFGGKTVTDTLAKVLEGEPDWKALHNSTPWRIQELLRRCLSKDPDERLLHVGEARIQIKKALEEPAAESPTGVAGAAQPVQRRWAMTAGVVALTAIVTSLVIWSLRPSSPPASQPLTQLVITPPVTAPLSDIACNELAISPDGRLIVYSVTRGITAQLYVRPLDGLTAELIPGTEGVRSDAFFSPDGESVAFFAEGKLKKVALKGGPPITLGEAPFMVPYGSWDPGGTILFTTGPGGLYSISAAGGPPERLAVPDLDKDELSYRRPKILPGGKTVLLTVWKGSDDQQIMMFPLETGEKKIVVESGRDAHYAPTGHLIYGLPAEGNPGGPRPLIWPGWRSRATQCESLRGSEKVPVGVSTMHCPMRERWFMFPIGSWCSAA